MITMKIDISKKLERSRDKFQTLSLRTNYSNSKRKNNLLLSTCCRQSNLFKQNKRIGASRNVKRANLSNKHNLSCQSKSMNNSMALQTYLTSNVGTRTLHKSMEYEYVPNTVAKKLRMKTLNYTHVPKRNQRNNNVIMQTNQFYNTTTAHSKRVSVLNLEIDDKNHLRNTYTNDSRYYWSNLWKFIPLQVENKIFRNPIKNESITKSFTKPLDNKPSPRLSIKGTSFRSAVNCKSVKISMKKSDKISEQKSNHSNLRYSTTKKDNNANQSTLSEVNTKKLSNIKRIVVLQRTSVKVDRKSVV